MARKAASAGPTASGRMRLDMILSSVFMTNSECIPNPTHAFIVCGFEIMRTKARATL